MLPITASGDPLCLLEQYMARPHAWVKLWKHHASQPQADRINRVASDRGEPFIRNYGGRTSAEWLFAKVLQILNEDPEIYEAAQGFVEAADWVTLKLTGTLVRNACGAGYKGFWSREEGFPSCGFLEALDPRLADFVSQKLPGSVLPPGQRAGTLTPAMANRLGLRPGTAVAVPIIDAHSAVPAATVVTPGRMVIVLGTSTCHMLLADRHASVEGVVGIVADGIVEGYYGYEAGQAAVGDIFAWFARLLRCPGESETAVFAALEREAAAAGPGGHGVIALDWWNGNRSVLMRAELSGLMVGMRLSTTAGDLYRSLIEASAFGTRRILASFEAASIPVGELISVGGLAERSPLLLQVYADITGRPLRLASARNVCALGAAMLGAVAAGDTCGGHASLADAARAMARLADDVAVPDRTRASVYDELYGHYLVLHDHFGRGGNEVMARLRRLCH